MIDDTMKMPEPIIEPATSIVESSRPSPRMSLFSASIGGIESANGFMILLI